MSTAVGRAGVPPLEALAGALAAALGQPVSVRAARPVGGGCISAAARLESSAGPFFAKWHPRPPPGLFGAEAAGLAALRASGTPLRVPEPLAWRDGGPGEGGFLVTEWLPAGAPGPGFEEALGAGLAALHRASAPAFGFPRDGYCGTTPQPNGPLPRWPDFYRERRLGQQVRLAAEAGRLEPGERRLYERLLARLEGLLPADGEPPALIHGDLWAGNVHVCDGGGPALVDPAAYFGHREAELGMMTLFGGFGPRLFDAYEAAWPLPAGWRERNGLYQLYHLLNHLNLFGGGYGGMALAVAKRYA